MQILYLEVLESIGVSFMDTGQKKFFTVGDFTQVIQQDFL